MTMSQIQIGQRKIGVGYPVFIIAEAGSNFDRDFEKAKTLIQEAKKAGADAVKFQLFKAEEFVNRRFEKEMYEAVQKNELPRKWLPDLKKTAEKAGIIFFATPFDLEAVDLLNDLDVPIFKIASGDITFSDLLRKAAQSGKPVILSTGMAYFEEAAEAVRILEAEGNRQIVLLHCTSSYPTPPEEVRIYGISELRKKFRYPIGFSDHSLGTVAPLAAVTLGASVIEKHFTLSRMSKGPDHPHSLEPKEFALMVNQIRELEKMLVRRDNQLTKSEMAIRDRSRRGLYAKTKLTKGTKLSSSMIQSLRPLKGLGSQAWLQIEGKPVGKGLDLGDVVTKESLGGK